MPFGDPDELKQEKALAFRTLTQALADLVGIVEHGGKRVPAKVGSDDLRDKPKEREELLAEVTEWFTDPDDGACSLNLVCAHLGFNPEAWRYQVRRYLKDPNRHAIVPNWRRLTVEDVIEIRLALAMGEPKSQIAKRCRVSRPTITKIANERLWPSVKKRSAA
jgi:hypothetical protein